MPEGASGKQQNAAGKCGRWPAKTLVGKIRKSCSQQNAGREVAGKFCCVESDEGECGLGDYHLKPYPYTYFLATHTLGMIINIRNPWTVP